MEVAHGLLQTSKTTHLQTCWWWMSHSSFLLLSSIPSWWHCISGNHCPKLDVLGYTLCIRCQESPQRAVQLSPIPQAVRRASLISRSAKMNMTDFNLKRGSNLHISRSVQAYMAFDSWSLHIEPPCILCQELFVRCMGSLKSWMDAAEHQEKSNQKNKSGYCAFCGAWLHFTSRFQRESGNFCKFRKKIHLPDMPLFFQNLSSDFWWWHHKWSNIFEGGFFQLGLWA